MGKTKTVKIKKEEVLEEPKINAEKVKKVKLTSRSKQYREVKAKVDVSKQYSVEEAVKLVKETSFSKFDGTVELHLVAKKTGVSANITLPYSTGRQKKIEVASDETIKKLQSGKIDFDVLLATAEMMPKLVPYARLLGPKGLMPNPRNGTLLKNIKDADKFSSSSTIRTESKAPLIHTVVGKVSQADKELVENTQTILGAFSSKQIVKAYIKATMGPSVKLNLE